MSTQQFLTGMGPHLNIAAICERHILETDGALTLFRTFDRFTVVGDTPEMPPTTLSFMLVVGFRSGEFTGSLDLGIKIIQEESIQTMQELRVPLNFEAPKERVALSIGQINLTVNDPGLYWIVISLSGQEYTRVPLRISYQRQPTVQIGTGAQ